jgi:hypothetical protein
MPVARQTSLALAVILCMSAEGCGGGSDHGPAQAKAIGQGRVVARCEHAMVGSGRSGNWRDDATAVGRLGFFGTGRDFRSAQKVARSSLQASHQLPSSGPILETKVPVVVEGRNPVDVSIAPADRARAGLVLAIQGGPYAEAHLIPCRDQPRTWWPGGWVLRNSDPVRVLVEEDGRPPAELEVGRRSG